ncbi:MAG: hypothetical protein GY711_06610 [bacterium]|nr:hypothetical protein [bacterium]
MRLKKILTRLALVTIAAAVLFEITLRVLLFSGASWGHKLRDPGLFADRWSDERWTLHHTFHATRRNPPVFDATLGWLHPMVEPETYAHEDEPTIAGHRPVLLYGDSFSACLTEYRDCWQGLLARSDLASSHALINYGTGGYGLDQAYLLFQQSIERFAHLDPIVVIGVLVDDDLDRSSLRLRDWPRPYFRPLADSGLELVEPVRGGVEAHLAAHPPRIASYAFRYLIYGARVLPRKECERLLGRGDHIPDTKDLNRRILEALAEELRARGLDHFFVLFHGERYIDETDWREQFLAGELERMRIPYVSSRLALRADRDRTGAHNGDYYIQEGLGLGHYNVRGNDVVFRVFLEGLRGQFAGGAR